MNLIFVERRNAIDDYPRKRTTKIDCLMHHKRHDAGSKHVVLHERIPSRPKPLKDIKLYILVRDGIVGAPVGIRQSVGIKACRVSASFSVRQSSAR